MKRFRVLFLALAILLAGSTARADGASAGRLTQFAVRTDEKKPERVIFELGIAWAYLEDQQNGTGGVLPDFKEESIVVSGSGKEIAVALDCVGAFDYAFAETLPEGVLASVTLQDKKGSRLQPNVVYTPAGRDLKSLEISITGVEDIFYQFIEIDRSRADRILLRFAVEKVKKVDGEEVRTTATVDITDVDIPYGRVVSAAGSAQNILRDLHGVPSETYVTILYPLAHIAPDRAKTLITPKLSLLGKVSEDADNPALLITDRADYVRSIVQALALFDWPVPQVEIEVRILEVAWSREERIGFDWGALRSPVGSDNDGQFFKGVLQTGVAAASPAGGGGEVMFGRLADAGVKILNAQIDLLSKQGRVTLLAAPRIVALNNTQAEFHAGAQIPVFKKTSVLTTESDEYNRSIDTASNDDAVPTNARSWGRDRGRNVTEGEELLDLGVRLEVTPRITQSGEGC
ncbi:MAG: hypothetical protein V1918_04875 [Planctomycetota bacterium]